MSSRPPISVLIVDDTRLVRETLRAALGQDARFGRLYEAADAAEGFSIFKVCRPDAVVLDLQLPDLNGIELLRMMKAAAPSTVVAILSSYHDSEIRDECLRRKADWFIEKSPGLGTVAQTLAWLCSGKARSISPPPASGPKPASEPDPKVRGD